MSRSDNANSVLFSYGRNTTMFLNVLIECADGKVYFRRDLRLYYYYFYIMLVLING